MAPRAPNINRSRVHEEMVQRLSTQKPPNSERTLFPTIRELLCFAALLGYSEGRKVPLDKSAGVEDISYQQFERGEAEDLIWLVALADTKNPEVLKDGEEVRCAEIFEEYANGGLYIIREALTSSGGEFAERDIVEMLMERDFLDTEDSEPDVAGITF